MRLDFRRPAPWLAAALLLRAAPAPAQEIHGFVEGLTGARTATADGFETGDVTAEEARVQLRLNDYVDDAEYLVRLDVFSDRLASADDLELREAFFTYSGWSWADVKIGRQILTWGTGDLLFVNDVFPKDWESFFVGREDQYLKAPLDAIRFGFYGDVANLSVVASPRFEPDRLPTPERLAFFDPTGTAAPPELPRDGLRDGEVAVRLDRTFGGTEVALYGYVGHSRQPRAFDPNKMQPFYPSLNVWGASIRRGFLGGVANFEGGYYDSRDDSNGTDPMVENSSLRGMFGFDRQLWTDFQLGLQGYYEWMRDHDLFVAALPAGAREPDELRQLYAVRATQFLKYQTVRLSAFAFVSPTDEDVYARFSVSYKLNDPVELVLGANVFDGSFDDTTFGQGDANDNVYLRARYSF